MYINVYFFDSLFIGLILIGPYPFILPTDTLFLNSHFFYCSSFHFLVPYFRHNLSRSRSHYLLLHSPAFLFFSSNRVETFFCLVEFRIKRDPETRSSIGWLAPDVITENREIVRSSAATKAASENTIQSFASRGGMFFLRFTYQPIRCTYFVRKKSIKRKLLSRNHCKTCDLEIFALEWLIT